MRGVTTTDTAVVTAMAAKLGLTPAQVEIGLALMQTGDSALIADVIAGRMTILDALAATRGGAR